MTRYYYNTSTFIKTLFHKALISIGYNVQRTKTLNKNADEYQTLLRLYGKELGLTLRPEKNDPFIFKEVFIDNCYQVAPSIAGQTVIDVGAHIGTFSLLALKRGAKKVIAIEPDPDSFMILTKHLTNFSNIVFYNKALWKNNTDELNLCSPSENLPTHFRALEENAKKTYRVCRKAKPITLAQIIAEQQLEKIDLLKIDIEGGEKEVFSSLPPELFAKIDCIVGEWHGHETPNLLEKFLSPFYEIELKNSNPNVDLFFATKKQRL